MNRQEELELLVSRYLDDECTDAERARLDRLLRTDPAVEAFFEESLAFDRETNYALRGALGKPLLRRRRMPLRGRTLRAIPVAVAAGIGLFLLARPPAQHIGDPRDPHAPRAAASWFAPAGELGDSLAGDPSQFNRPQVRLDQADRNWVVIPGAKPGEFFVVEVTQVRSRTIRIQDDF